MRRDEVSALAGISTAYYTWIEQGRKFDVSSAVLEAIAGALRLNDIESAHLFTLAGKAPQNNVAPDAPAQESPNALRQFANSFVHGPAMLLTPWLDIVAVNRSSAHELGIASGANLAEVVLCSTAIHRVANADTLAGAFVALLRRNYALDVENERFTGVIATLRSGNAAFKARWDTQVIDRVPLLNFELAREGVGAEFFHGVVVADPVAVRQFALFMYRSTEATPHHRC